MDGWGGRGCGWRDGDGDVVCSCCLSTAIGELRWVDCRERKDDDDDGGQAGVHACPLRFRALVVCAWQIPPKE